MDTEKSNRRQEVLSWFIQGNSVDVTDEAIRNAEKCMAFIDEGKVPPMQVSDKLRGKLPT